VSYQLFMQTPPIQWNNFISLSLKLKDVHHDIPWAFSCSTSNLIHLDWRNVNDQWRTATVRVANERAPFHPNPIGLICIIECVSMAGSIAHVWHSSPRKIWNVSLYFLWWGWFCAVRPPRPTFDLLRFPRSVFWPRPNRVTNLHQVPLPSLC